MRGLVHLLRFIEDPVETPSTAQHYACGGGARPLPLNIGEASPETLLDEIGIELRGMAEVSAHAVCFQCLGMGDIELMMRDREMRRAMPCEFCQARAKSHHRDSGARHQLRHFYGGE